MLFLFIIRRVSPRVSAIIGASLLVLGLAVVGLAMTVASWLFIHGVIATLLGVAFCVGAHVRDKNTRTAEEVPAAERPVSVVRG